MSWDILVLNYKGKPPPAELEDEHPSVPLGPAARVRKQIERYLPGVDWSDPTWGIYTKDEVSIEFNTGDDDPIDSIMLHVRGGGDAIGAMLTFAVPSGWSLLDLSTGEYLDPENPSAEGWEGFQEFRDQVMDTPQSKKAKGKGTNSRGKKKRKES